MHRTPPSDQAGFAAIVDPVVAALLDVVEHGCALRTAAGCMPAADSPAMSELAEERSLAGQSGEDPVMEASACPGCR